MNATCVEQKKGEKSALRAQFKQKPKNNTEIKQQIIGDEFERIRADFKIHAHTHTCMHAFAFRHRAGGHTDEMIVHMFIHSY